jgi:hypothetical protein
MGTFILYPKLSNGNVLWTCDNCGRHAEISFVETRRISIYCTCNRRCNPKCNAEYYTTGEYLSSNKIYVNKEVGTLR